MYYAPGVIHLRLCAFKMQSLAILDFIHLVNLVLKKDFFLSDEKLIM